MRAIGIDHHAIENHRLQPAFAEPRQPQLRMAVAVEEPAAPGVGEYARQRGLDPIPNHRASSRRYARLSEPALGNRPQLRRPGLGQCCPAAGEQVQPAVYDGSRNTRFGTDPVELHRLALGSTPLVDCLPRQWWRPGQRPGRRETA